MFKANQVADWFLARTDAQSGDTISHLKLQKLVYYAQAWHYTIFDEPVFEEKIEAWMHGPVVRSIYERFKNIPVYGQINVQEIEFDLPILTERSIDLLEEVKDLYGEHSANYLEELTHEENPWILARAGLPNFVYCD